MIEESRHRHHRQDNRTRLSPWLRLNKNTASCLRCSDQSCTVKKLWRKNWGTVCCTTRPWFSGMSQQRVPRPRERGTASTLDGVRAPEDVTGHTGQRPKGVSGGGSESLPRALPVTFMSTGSRFKNTGLHGKDKDFGLLNLRKMIQKESGKVQSGESRRRRPAAVHCTQNRGETG